MKKVVNIILVIFVILTGGLALFLFLDFEKNSKKLKKLVKNAKKFAEESTEKLEDNGFGEMGWSDLDWTNEEILSKKKLQNNTKEFSDNLQSYLSKVEQPVKKAVKSIEKSPVLKKIKSVQKNAMPLKTTSGFNNRQDEIISLIQDKRKLNMAEIAQKFPEITPRTLRRDMEKLEKLKVTKQIGKTRDSYYVLVGSN